TCAAFLSTCRHSGDWPITRHGRTALRWSPSPSESGCPGGPRALARPRHQHPSQTLHSWLKPPASLSGDPLADVCRAVRERDAVRFATLEKVDRVLTYQGHV